MQSRRRSRSASGSTCGSSSPTSSTASPGLLTAIAVVLVVTPVTISFPIAVFEAIGVLAGLMVTIALNALLLRHAFAPLTRLAQRMETVDLLRPGQRLQVLRDDEIGSVVT